MGQQRRDNPIAFYNGWILAGVAGVAVSAVAPIYIGEPTLPGGLAPDLPFYRVAVAAACLAYFQYIVLSALIGRVSVAALAWIPMSVATPLIAAYLASNIGVAANAAGVSFPQVSLPLKYASQGIVAGSVLGFAQGLVLSRLSDRRFSIMLWMSANALAGGLVGFATGVQFPFMVSAAPLSPSVEAALFANMVSSKLADAALYAAVTGPVLLALVGRRSDSQRPLARSPEMLVTQ